MRYGDPWKGARPQRLKWGELRRRDDFIMALVKCGYTYQQIGERMSISRTRVGQIVSRERRRHQRYEAHGLICAAQHLFAVEADLLEALAKKLWTKVKNR